MAREATNWTDGRGIVHLDDGVVIEPATPYVPSPRSGLGLGSVVAMTLVGLAAAGIAQMAEGIEASAPVALLAAVVIRVVRHAGRDPS